MEEIFERFVIDSDDRAEWALGKIKEAQEERDRLLALVEEKKHQLEQRQEEILKRYDSDTGYLLGLLDEYMTTVKVKKTKTQDTYQLLSGKLVRKYGGVTYKRDDAALVKWLEDNGHKDLVNVTVTPKWGEFKKLLQAEGPVVTIAETGEVVDGIVAYEAPVTFDIKFN